jgi:hypothetical protein
MDRQIERDEADVQTVKFRDRKLRGQTEKTSRMISRPTSERLG